MDDRSWPVTRYIGHRGYITVVNTLDSEDWRRPGVAEIVRRATPQGNQGAVVLMHDSGGDRQQTVRALDRYLPALQARGYRFDNLTEALGAPSALTPVTGADLWQGTAWILLVQASERLTGALAVCLALVGALVIARFALMVLLSAAHARRVRRRGPRWGPPVTARVSVVVPAYNEATCIENTVRSLVPVSTPWRSSSWTTAPPTAPPTSSRPSTCPASASSGSATRASPPPSTGASPRPPTT
jgi:hypothetical protein